MDIANVGAFLGGATDGVGQGMDLYAKYDEMKQKNADREQQRLMMEKTQQLAKDGVFKNDPVAGAKALGEYGAELGRMDWYQQYTETGDKLQKAAGQKAGMKAYVASHTSATDTAKYLNEFSATNGMPNKFAAITNPDGSITMQGMGDDPKAGKRYANMAELQNDTLMFLAPTMLSPEQLMEYDTNREKKQTDIGLGRAQTGKAVADTDETRALLPGKVGLLGGQTASAYANARQSDASAALAGTQAGDIVATRGSRLDQMDANVRATNQEVVRSRATLSGDVEHRNLENAGQAIENIGARRAEKEAEITQIPRIAGAVAGSAKAQAEATEAQVKAGYAGPKAAADVENTQAQSDYYRQDRGRAKNEDINEAVKGYVVDPTKLLPGSDPPIDQDQGAMTGLTTVIAGDTKVQPRDAAATANWALRNLDEVRFNPKTGEIMLDGQVIKVGQRALTQLKRLRDQAKQAR